AGRNTEIPVGFVPSPIPQLHGYYFHPEVARYLNDVMAPFTNVKEAENLLKYYDQLMNFWKGWATVPNIGFHMRNAMGNVYNNWLAGVRAIEDYVDAGKVLKNREATDQFLNIGNRRMSYSEIFNEARDQGILGRGHFGGDLEQGFARLMQMTDPWIERIRQGDLRAFSPFEIGYRVGRVFDDNTRLAHYI